MSIVFHYDLLADITRAFVIEELDRLHRSLLVRERARRLSLQLRHRLLLLGAALSGHFSRFQFVNLRPTIVTLDFFLQGSFILHRYIFGRRRSDVLLIDNRSLVILATKTLDLL